MNKPGRRFYTGLAVLVVICLLAAAASASGLVFSARAKARLAAEKALYDRYGITFDMLSYFNPNLIDRRYELAKNIPHIDRRRIEITRAIMSRPKVLLLDEPTAGLNDDETMEMMDDIRKIKEKIQNIAIIIIEHDMKVMEKVPEWIVVFNAGMKIAEGTYQDIIHNQEVIDAYIGGQEDE